MATVDVQSRAGRRSPLTGEEVLRAAVDLADREGLGALTMRRLAQDLGVEAMSLYYHIANKEALLDGVADLIIDEINEAVAGIEEPGSADGWKQAMRARILAAREILLRHPWAPAVISSRTAISLPTMRYYDGIVRLFRVGGLSHDQAHHALHALGSRALGFSQELFAPDDYDAGEADIMSLLEQMSGTFPSLAGMLIDIAGSHDPNSTLGWCDDQAEFEFGLDLLLDGLDRLPRPG